MESKEEPKQENCCTPIGQIKRYLNCVGCDRTPKQETNKTNYLDEVPNIDKDVLLKMWNEAMPKLEPKQETLEEVALRLIPYKSTAGWMDSFSATERIGFVRGAKWNQEQNKDKKYTEEDIREAIRNTITYLATLSETGKFHSGNIIEESIIQSLNKQE